MNNANSIINQKIYRMLVKLATPDGRISRKNFYYKIAERFDGYKNFSVNDWTMLIKEFSEAKMVLSANKFNLFLNKNYEKK